MLDDVRLPAEALLPKARGVKGALASLSEARYGIIWGAMGAARSAWLAARDYATARTQFGKPIAGFQLTQAKLVDMAVELHKGQLLSLHLGRLKDTAGLRPEQVSFGKLNNTRSALEICRTARTILGGNGISLEYPVIRHMVNLESVLTYEGTPRCTSWCSVRRSPASAHSAEFRRSSWDPGPHTRPAAPPGAPGGTWSSRAAPIPPAPPYAVGSDGDSPSIRSAAAPRPNPRDLPTCTRAEQVGHDLDPRRIR